VIVTGKKALKLIEERTNLGGSRIVYAARYLNEGSTDNEILYPKGTPGRGGDKTQVETSHLINLIVAANGCENLTDAAQVVRKFRQMEVCATRNYAHDDNPAASALETAVSRHGLTFGQALELLVDTCMDSDPERRTSAREAITEITLARDGSSASIRLITSKGNWVDYLFDPPSPLRNSRQLQPNTPAYVERNKIRSVVTATMDGEIIGLIADLVTDNVRAGQPEDTASDGGSEQGKATPKAEPNSKNGNDGFGRAEPSSVEASQRGATPANLISNTHTHREYGDGHGGNQLFRPSPGLSPAKGPPPTPKGDRLCHAEFPPPTFCVA
jgi:hypothetical protein